MEALAVNMARDPARQKTRALVVDPRTDPLWHELVSTRKSSVFHSPAWIRAITETYGWNAYALVLLGAEGEPAAGVPFCSISDIMSERTVVLPFSDYCDPIVTEAEHWSLLAEKLFAAGGSFTFHCLEGCPPGEGSPNWPWQVVKRARWHGIDMRPDEEEIWRRFDHVAQGNIRKARREGVVVRIAKTEEESREFFDMHLRVRKYKYRLLAQPYRLFEAIWRDIIQHGKGALMVAERGDRVIAGGLFLNWADTMYYKFNTSDPNFLSCRPNDLLIWEAIKYGKSQGLIELDFGRTDWDHTELARYKRKFGAYEKTITLFRYGGDPALTPQDKQVRALLPQLTDLFTDPRVPDDLTERAGDIMYGFFA